MSASVTQAGVTYISFLLTTQLESVDWRKIKNHDLAPELRNLGIELITYCMYRLDAQAACTEGT